MAERIVPERFLDAAQEPEQTLTPIRGYEKSPLVSLKEAIQPIKSLLFDVDTMIEIAKRNSKKPADDLTSDESAAIHLYTMQWPPPHPSLFSLLNERLRSEDRYALLRWFLYLKLFLTALYKIPSYKGIIWRGVRGNISDQYDDDGDHIWWGTSSCTESMKVMETFIDNDGVRTIFTIECIHGKRIRSHSHFKKENEILLMPGSYFQVVGKWKAGKDLYMIQLRQKTPSFQTLASPLDSSCSAFEKLTISTSTKRKEKIKWKQNGITIAGGNGRGDKLNQLDSPWGIFVDNDQTIYIADNGNDRIVQWESGAKEGKIIAGGNGKGHRIDQLNWSADVCVDQQNNSLIIADRENSRVIRCSLANPTNKQIIIENIHCYGVTMDKDGSIYVSDCKKNEVKRWKKGEKEGTIVAGRNQLRWPMNLFVDEDYSIYVSDWGNNRVMKWEKDAKEGIVVAGGNGKGNQLNQLSSPRGVVVDHLGHIYVADGGNDRVMRWCEGCKEGEIVVGGNGKGNQSNQLSYLTGLSFDVEENLYVADFYNRRIQKFEIDLN